MAALDPYRRWTSLGIEGKPDFAGLLSWAALPYTEDPEDLAGVDAAIVGAPMDDLVSERPGTRYGPRAIRAASTQCGPHQEAKIDFSQVLQVVDFGDAPVVPRDVERSHAAIEQTVGQVVHHGAVPMVLGGDHSIVEPDLRACAKKFGPLGLVHFDAHTDTSREVMGLEMTHGTGMFRLIEQGAIDPNRYVQIGLRGYWPPDDVFGWQASRGIRSWYAHDVRDSGIKAVMELSLAAVGPGPVFLSIDVDCLDPAFVPGTGTPEPGGLLPRELLWACRTAAASLDVVGADIVEVAPLHPGPLDTTSLVADRLVREVLTGIALRRQQEQGA